MKSRVNSYLAALFITVAGAGAAMLVIRIADADASHFIARNDASHALLKQSLLNR